MHCKGMKPDTNMQPNYNYYYRFCRVFVPESHVHAIVGKQDIQVPHEGGVIVNRFGKSALEILRAVPEARFVRVRCPLSRKSDAAPLP
jgi:hypothetical protein